MKSRNKALKLWKSNPSTSTSISCTFIRNKAPNSCKSCLALFYQKITAKCSLLKFSRNSTLKPQRKQPPILQKESSLIAIVVKHHNIRPILGRGAFFVHCAPELTLVLHRHRYLSKNLEYFRDQQFCKKGNKALSQIIHQLLSC